MRGTCVQNWCHKLSYRLWLMVVLWGAITKRRPTAQSRPQHISWHSKLLLALEGFPDSSNSLVLFTLRLAKNKHLCKLFIYSLIGGKLLYNFVVVAAAQHLNSAIIAYISSLLGRPPLPPRPCRPLQSARLGSLCYTQRLTSSLLYALWCVCVCASFSLLVLSLPYCIHKAVLCLHLHPFPADGFIIPFF